MIRLVAWRGPVLTCLALSLLAISINVQRVVGETVVNYSDSRTASGSRGWDWLRPFRLQQEPVESRPKLAPGKVVQALATDRPQQPSKVRPASAANTTSDSVASLEWPSSEAGIPPDFSRRSSRRKRPGWLNWSPLKGKTKEALSEPQNRQKPQGPSPFAWVNLAEPEGQESRARNSNVRNVAAESSPEDSRGAIQNLRPFSWTNTTESSNELAAANQASREPSRFEAAAESVLPTQKELTSPITWSNQGTSCSDFVC